MTTSILVSADTELRSRWRAAFPGSRAAGSIEEAARADAPGLLVWLHIDASPEAAATAVESARRLLPKGRLVVLSDTPSDDQALDLMQRGAAGYCHSFAGSTMLHQVATVVSNEGLWVGPNLLQRIIRASGAQVRPGPGSDVALDVLSAREREVADQVGQGSSNKEIARQLDITERTVKAHLSAIFLKLGVRDRLHLALLMRSRSA